jgi:hypothetical protein
MALLHLSRGEAGEREGLKSLTHTSLLFLAVSLRKSKETGKGICFCRDTVL